MRSSEILRGSVLVATSFACLLLLACGGHGDDLGAPPPQSPLPECVADPKAPNIDPQKPIITLNGPNVVSQPVGSPYVEAGATATDPQDGDITSRIEIKGADKVNTAAAADFLIRYNVSNNRGSAANEVVRVVRVNAGQFVQQSKRHFGETSSIMGYFEHLPVNYSNDPSAKFPVIIHNHGVGEAPDFTQNDDDQWARDPDKLDLLLRRGLSAVIDRGEWDNSRPFIVLSPQRCVNFSSDAKEEAFVQYALNTYNIDPARVYMTGFSMGAGNTWIHILNHPHELAAAVTISGGIDTSPDQGCTMKDTPTWSFHSADDKTVPVTSTLNTVAAIKACNPTLPHKVTIFQTGGHLIDMDVLEFAPKNPLDPRYDPFDEDVYRWLLQFTSE